jgi:hypothetical protein
MTEITSTSFGLIIANLLPGLAGLAAFSFWSSYLTNLFRTFLETKSSVGLFLFVLSLSLIIGLQIATARWILFEKILAKVLNVQELTSTQWKRIDDPNKRAAFVAAIDEYYRYYQFSGGMTVVIPIFIIGWFWDPITTILEDNVWLGILTIVSVAALELLTGWAAYYSYSTTMQRASDILSP